MCLAIASLAMPGVATADPQLVEATDPAGADVRAAAEAFLMRVAEADAAGAAELFAGDAAQAAVPRTDQGGRGNGPPRGGDG